MKIAYRRMSGPIGTSTMETGTRGMWLEKRQALYWALLRRGHSFDFVNRMTKFSQQAAEPEFGPKTHDLLIIEFGSSNIVFNGKDLARTQEMAKEHRGPIIFLNDDPDLPYLWDTLDPKRDAGRWSMWMNAKRPQPFGGAPDHVKCFDAPFAALMPAPREPLDVHGDTLVYIGRPNGRTRAVKDIIAAGVPWKVYGNAKEWKAFEGLEVHPAPTQAQRSGFYSSQLGTLVLADNKHKKLGWRTGRAYHSLYAGCPPLLEVDHEALAGDFPCFTSGTDARRWAEEWTHNAKARANHWKRATRSIILDQSTMEETFRAAGL